MQKPLRIAVFVGTFPVVSETFILRQITGLLDLGHQVDVFADARSDIAAVHPEVEKYQLLSRTTFMDGPDEAMIAEMPVWPLWGRTWPPGSETSIHNCTRVARALPKFLLAFARSPRLALQTLQPAEYDYRAASLSVLYRLAKLCRVSQSYDVLHAHFGPVGNMFRFARELWKAPLIVSFHGYDFSTLPRREGRDMYSKLFGAADAITANSSYTQKELEKLGCPPKKLRQLPVGLDPERFTFRERRLNGNEPVRILTVARLVEIKGIEFVVRAIARLRQSYSSIRYDVIGDGPLRSKLQALTCELGLEEVVTLHGAKAGGDVKQFFDAAHLFVLTSVSVEGDQEGQGLVLQEAQACGLPVICTRHGAFPEGILPDHSGFLVPERDPEALASCMAMLIENSAQWPRIGRAGRQYAIEKYDIGKLNANLVGIYEEAISSFQRGK